MIHIYNAQFKYIQELNDSTIQKREFFFNSIYADKTQYDFEYTIIFNSLNTLTEVCNKYNIDFSTCYRRRKNIDNKIKKNYNELIILYNKKISTL